jgi:hypothetical protein
VVQFDALTGALRTARRVSMQPIHSLAPTLMGRGLLVRAGSRELYALQPSQMSVQWRRAFTEDLVSPVVASTQSEVGAVVDKQGRLFVFHTRFGFNLPLYPQTLFGDQQLSQRVGGDCAPCGTRGRLCLCAGATRARGDQPASAVPHRDAGEPAQPPWSSAKVRCMSARATILLSSSQAHSRIATACSPRFAPNRMAVRSRGYRCDSCGAPSRIGIRYNTDARGRL